MIPMVKKEKIYIDFISEGVYRDAMDKIIGEMISTLREKEEEPEKKIEGKKE